MAQDAVTRLGREALSQCTRDELIDLADRELARTAAPLVFLAEASRHEAALDDRIASLYERALRSPSPLVRFHAAWCVVETRACWARFIPVLQAAREAEDDESNRENIDVVIDLLQTELRDEEEERIRWAHPGLARVEYDVTRRRALSGEELTSLEQAIDFLRMPYDIYHWYSERSLNMSLERALASLQKLERWWDEIAPSFQSEAPYEHSDPFMDGDSIHPLGAYIISSQFLWHYHESDQAERHLLRSFHLAETLVTRGRGGPAPVMPRAPLKERYLDNVSRAYHDPRLYTVNHFYLGELLLEQADPRGALDLLRQEIETLSSYPDPDPSPNSRCLPFEPREVVERFRAWRSHPMAPRHGVDVVARSVLRFLKGLSVEPYRFAYPEWSELAQQVESASSPSA
jgi:hypothetical protein